MKQIKNIEWQEGHDYAEIFQSLDIKFTLLDHFDRQAAYPFKCRDFLIDMIYSSRTSESISIYGFKYNYADCPFDTEKTRLHMIFPNRQSRLYLQRNLPRLQEFFGQVGISLTPYKVVGKEELVIVSEDYWLKDTWKISFLTLMLKFASYKEMYEFKYGDTEFRYYKTVESRLSDLLSLVPMPTSYWINLNGKSTQHVHDNGGVISYIKSGQIDKDTTAHVPTA